MSGIVEIPALSAHLASGPRRRVVVAMSGGVDSSVVAALLAAAGHDVIGITLQLYNQSETDRRAGTCCAGQDIHDARRVAGHLGIPHYVLDYEERFRSRVMDAFASSYVAGETPVPCISCNRDIKFRDLLDTAGELGADALATGHYIDRRETPDGPALHRALDGDRDQSYFLFATTREQLARLWFPLGALPKSEVRRIAAELGVSVAAKPDSQDICFVGKSGYASVIERLHPGAARDGDIVHVDGRLLGRHDGIVNFTVGQRRGLGVATGDPLFVVRLDPAKREVIVGPRACLEVDEIKLRDVNWIGTGSAETAARDGLAVHVRVRSTQAPRPARLALDGATGAISARLGEGEMGVACGQACVIYEDGSSTARMLGGGFIAATGRTAEVSAAVAVDALA